MFVGSREFDGMTDFIFCSNDVNEEFKYQDNIFDYNVVCIKDPSINQLAKNLEFKVMQKNESIFLVQSPFNYEFSNGVFIKLHPEEEYPLMHGSIFQMGTKNQFIMERFNTGIIAARGKRVNMEDSFIINHDFNLHPQLPLSLYSVMDGHGGEWCA